MEKKPYFSDKVKEVLTKLYHKEDINYAEYEDELYYLRDEGLVYIIPADNTIYLAYLTPNGKYSVKIDFQNFNQSSSSNYIHDDNNTIVCNNESIKNSFNTENNQWNDCFKEFMESDINEEIKELFQKLNNENQDMLKNMIKEITATAGEKNKISCFKKWLYKIAKTITLTATSTVTEFAITTALNKILLIFANT